jgi:hypothetical protein
MPTDSTESKRAILRHFEVPTASVVGHNIEADAYWREQSNIIGGHHGKCITAIVELDLWLHTEYQAFLEDATRMILDVTSLQQLQGLSVAEVKNIRKFEILSCLQEILQSSYLQDTTLEITHVAKGIVYHKMGSFCFDLDFHREAEIYLKLSLECFNVVSNDTKTRHFNIF